MQTAIGELDVSTSVIADSEASHQLVTILCVMIIIVVV